MRDATLVFGTNLDVGTTAGADAAKGDVIDLGSLLDHKGSALAQNQAMRGMFLNISVDSTNAGYGLKGDGTGTVKFILRGADDATPIDGVVLASCLVTFTTTAIADGTLLCSIPVPAYHTLVNDANSNTSMRYLALSVDIDTANLVDDYNEVTAWLSFGPHQTNL